ncbi:MAG: phosphoribosyl-AMP cyclohydrolase [Thermodesulfobacteriota bacterium]
MTRSTVTADRLAVDFAKGGGLVPAIAQDVATGKVLMLAYMNREALETTLKEGRACYWSRSRQELWRKGATSGDVQLVREIRVDCDQDTILLLVDQQGEGACHTKKWSCFHYRINPEGEIEEIVD